MSHILTNINFCNCKSNFQVTALNRQEMYIMYYIIYDNKAMFSNVVKHVKHKMAFFLGQNVIRSFP